MRDSHLNILRISAKERTGFLMFKLKCNYLIYSKINLKIIWKFLFFDFIFAEEILESRIKNYELPMMTMSSLYKNTEAMAFNFKSHSGQPACPSLDRRFYKTQVYDHYRLIG